jgi:hypothetical protein
LIDLDPRDRGLGSSNRLEVPAAGNRSEGSCRPPGMGMSNSGKAASMSAALPTRFCHPLVRLRLLRAWPPETTTSSLANPGATPASTTPTRTRSSGHDPGFCSSASWTRSGRPSGERTGAYVPVGRVRANRLSRCSLGQSAHRSSSRAGPAAARAGIIRS